jgi:hypothetical protein
MNKTTMKIRFVFYGLLLIGLFPRSLSAQSDSNTGGYDYEGKAIVAILPFAGDGEAAEIFNRATITAVNNLQKYSPRQVNIKNPTGAEGSFSWSSGWPMGLVGGLEAAMRLGPRMILADLRFTGDFDRITIHDAVDTAYRRGMISFSLGYSLGFFSFSKEGNNL